MGFLKKIFKPVSKVLDKIIPNEIKPALPFAAAFAPYLLPTGIMGAGMAQRALMGGGLNILGQLSQEGNEGDINLLSAGLGALTGAMTAPGTPGKAIGLDSGGANEALVRAKGTGSFQDFARSGIERFGADSAIGEIAKGGIKAADFMQAPGLLKYTAPVAQATGDLMFAQAKRDQDEYDRMMEEEAEAGAASDAQRALAIRQSMEAYGFTEEEILAAIEAAGYKKGGRVGFRFGGIGAAIDKVEDESIKESAKMVADMPDMDLMDLIEEFEIIFKRKPMNIEELKQFYKETYEMESPVRMKEKIKETVTVEAKDGGRIGLREGGVSVIEQITAQNFIPGLGRPDFQPFARPLLSAGQQPVFPRLRQLEQGIDTAESDLGSIRSRLGNQEGRLGGLMGIQTPAFGLQPFAQNPFLQNTLRSAIEPQGMKEGGMMDLGGKEMDLRGGGFVPIGKKEKADDVPARLSKNEFVMTADAVRAAGGGSVNKGAKRMYNLMNTLEARA